MIERNYCTVAREELWGHVSYYVDWAIWRLVLWLKSLLQDLRLLQFYFLCIA